jgi:DNA polymerase V
MSKSIFALIDCNNFFASCERLFRPDLVDKPVVVFSSNDGVVVARSNEAKALGIPMGAPVFKYRQVLRDNHVAQFSANFELYGDMSRRITEILTTVTPRIEVYSVDESFLDLSMLPIRDHTAWAQNLRRAIWQWTGIPVSIGIATTKTLAKLASDRGKKDPALGGVLNLMGNPDFVKHLSTVPVEDVWGVGWRLSPKVRAEGVGTAFALSLLRPQRAQQLMGIRGRQLVAELNGISCFPLELEQKIRKSIARTRTFGEDTHDLSVLEAAIASFATQAAFRLRRSGQLTRRASLFITSNKNKPGYRRFSRELIYHVPTADTGRLINDLVTLLGKIYNPHVPYHRAGVLLYDFVPASQLQIDLLGEVDVREHDKATTRMQVVDILNERYGKRTIHYATEDLANAWQPKHDTRSPRYTTHLHELPAARINIKSRITYGEPKLPGGVGRNQ